MCIVIDGCYGILYGYMVIDCYYGMVWYMLYMVITGWYMGIWLKHVLWYAAVDGYYGMVYGYIVIDGCYGMVYGYMVIDVIMIYG